MWWPGRRADGSRSATPDGADIDADLASRVRLLEIQARRRAASSMQGDYRSVFRGAGIEFAEAREYVPGDDVRLIDWNVTARTGNPWVKEYVEEREVPIVCAVDVSASQRVGRPIEGRLGVAAELTALLALSAAHHGDRAGLLLFDGGIDLFVAPQRGTRHALRLVREVLGCPTLDGSSDLAGASEYLLRVLRRRSVIFLITDGLVTHFEAAVRALARRHDVIALTLTDENDLVLPDVGLIDLEDAETGLRVLLDSSDRLTRDEYGRAARARAATRQAGFRLAGVDEVELPISGDHVTPLVRYFRQRAAARA
ncbi:MAG: DUF58 domain-containing protein [Dehalococcoidia bacterium]|nr:DUF58 domain-containing protein [Dehalococcoidia bacterium]